MIIRNRDKAHPFTTKDGSTIRSILDMSNAPVRNQSLAEATVAPGGRTTRHVHRTSEEFYYVLAGTGRMELRGEEHPVRPGDAILIPADTEHTLFNSGHQDLVFLCCCSPPYSHEDTVLDEPD